MVSTVEETRYFTALAKDYGLKTTGVMVEVPSSALLADRILQIADFASIGTNDLTQYTLAADRCSVRSRRSRTRGIRPSSANREVGAAGRANGKPVGICGEAAADPLLAVVLVGLGATTLSMAPTALADVRARRCSPTRSTTPCASPRPPCPPTTRHPPREAAQAGSSLVPHPVNPGTVPQRPVDTAADAASPPARPAVHHIKETQQ